MEVVFDDGTPVLLSHIKDVQRRIGRIRPKKRGRASKAIQHKMGKLSYDERVAMTLRERTALKNWLGGDMSKEEAGQSVGNKTGEIVNRAMDKLSKNEAFIDEMERQNLTEEFIVGKIKEGMDAQHPLAADGRKDYHAIDKFTDKALRIQGGYAPTKIEQKTESKIMHLHLTADDTEALVKYKRMREAASEVP